MHKEVFRATAFDPQQNMESKLMRLRMAWLLPAAMEGGWLDWNSVGLRPRDATAYYHRFPTNKWPINLTREKAWSWVDNQGWTVDRISLFTLNQIRWLREVNCLDLVDHEKLIHQITSVQVLSGTPGTRGAAPIHDWRDVRGLFFTPCYPALQDTYVSLAALEILGGLDKIDREQCVRGNSAAASGQGILHFAAIRRIQRIPHRRGCARHVRRF